MKVILIDNLNREYIEDNLLKDNLSESEARKMADDYKVVRKAHSFRGGMDSTFIL